MKMLGLRIKKKYLEQILSGEKTSEYRAVKPFYKGIDSGDYTHVLLHYQGIQRCIAKIISIKKIPNPLTGPELKLVPTKFVYEIKLKDAVEFSSYMQM